jgi:DeoR/GlpR family transcriptional regulator of sugar metabolism
LSVEELAKKFDVSPLTIRRDLERLENDRAILRTHGGCVLRATVESVYHRRVALNFELKQAIGRAAAKEVKSGDAILINDGSTPFHLAPHLGGIDKLYVYTKPMSGWTSSSLSKRMNPCGPSPGRSGWLWTTRLTTCRKPIASYFLIRRFSR